MNWIDIVFVIPLCWAAYKGFTKGLIVEIAAVLSLLLGIYFSIAFADTLAIWLLKKYSFSYQFAIILAFVLAFVTVVIAVYFLAKLVESLAKAIALNLINKIGGSVFSIVKYMLIISVIISVFAYFHADKLVFSPENQEKSLLYKPVEKIAPLLIPKLKKLKIPEKIEDIAQQTDSTLKSTQR